MHIDRFCIFGNSFFLEDQSAELRNSHCRKQDQICGKRKAEEINDRAEGERNNRLYILVYEQMGRLMRADIEHIEVFLQSASKSDLVEDHRNTHRAGKYGHCLENRFVLKLHVTGIKQIDRNCDHGTVTDGSLDIDADGFNVDIAGNTHRDASCEHGVGGKVSTKCIVDLSLSDDTRKQTDIHRRGAKLERERIPLVIKGRAATERKIDLLIDLENDNGNGNAQNDPSDALGLVLFVKDTK